MKKRDTCFFLKLNCLNANKSVYVGCNFSAFSGAGTIKLFYLSFTAVLRVAGSLQKSTEVMKAMQNLVKIPEIQATMRELSKEMMKVRSRT